MAIAASLQEASSTTAAATPAAPDMPVPAAALPMGGGVGGLGLAGAAAPGAPGAAPLAPIPPPVRSAAGQLEEKLVSVWSASVLKLNAQPKG